MPQKEDIPKFLDNPLVLNYNRQTFYQKPGQGQRLSTGDSCTSSTWKFTLTPLGGALVLAVDPSQQGTVETEALSPNAFLTHWLTVP